MKDNYIPSSSWEFNSSVTSVFDDMLSRSIPGFNDMRTLTTNIAQRFAQQNTSIIDLGCSRGGAIADLVDSLDENISFIGVEISDPMRLSAQERFIKYGPRVQIINMDLKSDFPEVSSSVVLCVLTLQFIPIEYRQNLLRKIYDSLCPNGVFILVEKILGNNAIINELFTNEYYKLKGENGYTSDQINAKRKSLEGVLVPVTAEWNQDMLRECGFSNIECFWRNLNFAGWVAIK